MRKLRPSAALPFAALALGVCAGVLRYFEITEGLSIAGFVSDSPLVAEMRIAAVAGCVLLILAALASKPNTVGYGDLFAPKLPKTAMVTAGFALLLAALVGMLTGYFRTRSILRLVLAMFAAFGGATAILSVGKPPQEGERDSRGLFTVIPVFAFSFLLLALFVLHAGDADVELFGYGTVAGVALCAAAYYSSASAYGEAKPRRALAASLAATFLATLVAVGEILTHGDAQIAAFFAASAVWSTAYAMSLVLPLPERIDEAPVDADAPSDGAVADAEQSDETSAEAE